MKNLLLLIFNLALLAVFAFMGFFVLLIGFAIFLVIGVYFYLRGGRYTLFREMGWPPASKRPDTTSQQDSPRDTKVIEGDYTRLDS